VLTSRGASLKKQSQSEGNGILGLCIVGLYSEFLGYASETWAVKGEDMARLARTEGVTVLWMCDVRVKSSVELNSRLGIECITDVVKWFGHVKEK